ncbi:hypothetical protein CW755_05510 [Geobacillus thermodenitrificans]|nr:hypothetical protein GTHT12_00830 [Geobacillus thermodenitrificans]NNU88721.1 hypothetical protein [Geobacillus sp. MR]OQP08435.1 hypothetical protein B1691_15440 [Geobacillus sp. 47C-IIb]MEC5186281.1 hypothetical protein [Geobacillus thermodenitrificans]PJW20408.1 hypothetical protein CV632_07665 [Geobacillus thermodenitrificans]
MKTMIQAFAISLVAHVVYIAATISLGYWKTKMYQPDIASAWESVDQLSNEVVFGQAGPPIVYVWSLIGVTMISAVVLYVYKAARR